MLNTSKSTHRNRFRIVALVPVTIALFLGTAISNGQNSSDAVSNRSNDQFVVVVDAGHGGFDKGATAKDNEFEKDINLSITKMLKERERSNSNVKIICTREDDNFITLNDRVEKVNGVNPDLFISIHVDAFKENDQVSGIKCYSAITPKYVVESSKAGTMLMDELKQLSGIKTHDEARQANFLVLRESRCPAVLLTLGYLTNENDLTFIADKKNQALVCDKIIDAIEKVRNN